MSRSTKKGPYVDQNILKKIARAKPEQAGVLKTWARASEISPEMVGYVFAVHTGKDFVQVKVNEEMVGHRLGEFAPTRKFVKHGGKLTKEIEQKAAVAESAAKAAAKPAAGGK
ncbi:MAG: hypothetical protein RL681_464 [Candidatus Parcubacteria bacterium]|jgi:small subunit ribosomal protein S19